MSWLSAKSSHIGVTSKGDCFFIMRSVSEIGIILRALWQQRKYEFQTAADLPWSQEDLQHQKRRFWKKDKNGCRQDENWGELHVVRLLLFKPTSPDQKSEFSFQFLTKGPQGRNRSRKSFPESSSPWRLAFRQTSILELSLNTGAFGVVQSGLKIRNLTLRVSVASKNFGQRSHVWKSHVWPPPPRATPFPHIFVLNYGWVFRKCGWNRGFVRYPAVDIVVVVFLPLLPLSLFSTPTQHEQMPQRPCSRNIVKSLRPTTDLF